MVIGILQVELLIHDASSLKDKRRVVRSLRDRLHREHLVSIAEVDAHDALARAVLGIACVARDGQRAAEVLDAVTAKLRGTTDAELGATRREIIQGRPIGDAADDEPIEDPGTNLDAELLRLAEQPEADPT